MVYLAITELLHELKEASKEETKTFLENFGINTRFRREQIGMSTPELANLFGVVRTSITNMELGRQNIPLGKLPLLAKILETSPEKLISYKPIFPDKNNNLREGKQD